MTKVFGTNKFTVLPPNAKTYKNINMSLKSCSLQQKRQFASKFLCICQRQFIPGKSFAMWNSAQNPFSPGLPERISYRNYLQFQCQSNNEHIILLISKDVSKSESVTSLGKFLKKLAFQNKMLRSLRCSVFYTLQRMKSIWV